MGIVDVVGLVRSIIGQIEEERILQVAMNESDGIVGRNIGIVTEVTPIGIFLDMPQSFVVEPPIGIIVGIVGI